MGKNDARNQRRMTDKEEVAEDRLLAAEAYLDEGRLLGTVQEQDIWLFLKKDGRWAFIKPAKMHLYVEEIANDPKFRGALITAMGRRGMNYMSMASSYRKLPDDCFNLIDTSKWAKAIDDGERHHWMFDVLMQSLGSNREENIDHLQHLIFWKWFSPIDSFHLPLMVVHGEGSVGKNLLFSSVFPAMFTKPQVKVTNKGGAFEKFNSDIEGRAVVLVDEGAETSGTIIKQIVGEDVLNIEHKGVNRYEVDNTSLFFVSSNNAEGGVWLDRSDNVNRRFSIMKVEKNQPIEYWLCLREGIKPTQANILKQREWVRTEGATILRDPVQVGRWLSFLEKLYWERGIPHGLHGHDYQELMDLQEPLETRVFASIFLDEKFTHIEYTTLHKCYMAIAKEHNIPSKYRLGDRKMAAKAEDWIRQFAPHIGRKRVHLDARSRQPEVYYNEKLDQKAYAKSNNHQYISGEGGMFTYCGPELV